jgi:hypothetical protein
MERLRHPGTARLAMASRGLWPDRNPLRRGTDRAEAIIVAALLALFLVGAPLAAVLAGHFAYAAASRAQHAQQAAWQQVPAVLLQRPPAVTYPAYQARLARWTAPDGTTRTGDVPASALAPARATVMVWVDRSGRLTGRPETGAQVSGQALLAEVFTPLLLALVLLTTAVVARRALDRRRMAAWDSEWRAAGPQWTQRR